MEVLTGKKFGDEKNPLLVSIRSGARRSMPGMMETVLNVGLNENEKDPLSIWHHDRNAESCYPGRADGACSGFLQLWHQRSDTNELRFQPR